MRPSPFNMWVEVATSRLYAVRLRNYRKALETKITVIHRRSGCSSSNSDVERGAHEAQIPVTKNAL
jgi:hypothetical protein